MSHDLLHQLVQPNAAYLGAFVLASIAFVALVLLLDRLATRIASAQRHRFVMLALLAPVVLFIAGLFHAPAASAPAAARVSTRIAAMDAGATPAPAASREWICILIAVWFIGALLAISKAILDAQRWRGVLRRAEDRGMFSLSEEICEPMVAGIVAPRILLPARGYVEHLTFEELETVFAHEEEHIERRDNLVALVTRLASSLFWFDPIHGLARRRLVELREQACDEAVLARGCDAEPYVAALAKSCRGALHAPAVACMSRIRFRERMEYLMSFDRNRLLPLSSWTVRSIFFAVLVIAAGSFAIFAPPASFALEEPQSEYEVTAYSRRATDGRIFVVTSIKSPDGSVVSSTEFRNAPDIRVSTNTIGARECKTTIRLNADGSGTVTLEVLDGARTVTRSERTFEAAVTTATPLAPPAPPAPPRPEGYRVGGNVKAPVVVTRVEPVYPAEAKANGISGIVILEVVVTETGEVKDARVLKSLPHGLDQAAIDAIKHWKFLPGTIDGAPVPVLFNLTINFRLD